MPKFTLFLLFFLYKDITNHNCKDLVQSVPFFRNASQRFVSAVITKLKFEVFLKDEYIIRAGTKGDRMFFIKSGTVEVVVDGNLATLLSDGSHFGEICLLTDDRRVADVVASTITDLFSLSKENFDLLLAEFPDMREPLEEVAIRRLSKIGKKASFQESVHSARHHRISTHIPPPPIAKDESTCPGNVDEALEKNDTDAEQNSNRSEMQKLERISSVPTRRRKVCAIDPPRSFSESGKTKLPPLDIDRHKRIGEPSDSNPNLIKYPTSDSSTDSDDELK